MIIEIAEELLRIIVIDISGTYARIYDERYILKSSVKDFKRQYSDTGHWRVLILN